MPYLIALVLIFAVFGAPLWAPVVLGLFALFSL